MTLPLGVHTDPSAADRSLAMAWRVGFGRMKGQELLQAMVQWVLPLQRAPAPFQAWITGGKRFHGAVRTALPAIEFVANQVKVNPLANWTPDLVKTAFRARGLPVHPLVPMAYPSIDCAACTRPTGGSRGSRVGRRAGREKTECGIHLSPGPPHLVEGSLNGLCR
ncbi:MAG: phosphoadenosine phosphosulfate reductase family protein [Proteobacteria bacterium]|nr:phosphoadenosine phosphosulfate reductase family protein [Pseudomonadota bacterium]